MAKTTGTIVAQLDPHALRRIDDHPDVQPLAEAHYRLQADQRRLTSELIEARKIIASAEREGGDPLVPSRTLRDARRQEAVLQDALIELQTQLAHSSEHLETVRTHARGELRPMLRHEAVQTLTTIREAAEALLTAQAALLNVEWHGRRLGISLAVIGCCDPLLAQRLEMVQKVLVRLQD
jgi:hypothetical protein